MRHFVSEPKVMTARPYCAPTAMWKHRLDAGWWSPLLRNADFWSKPRSWLRSHANTTSSFAWFPKETGGGITRTRNSETQRKRGRSSTSSFSSKNYFRLFTVRFPTLTIVIAVQSRAVSAQAASLQKPFSHSNRTRSARWHSAVSIWNSRGAARIRSTSAALLCRQISPRPGIPDLSRHGRSPDCRLRNSACRVMVLERSKGHPALQERSSATQRPTANKLREAWLKPLAET